jgi:hypothetical protein
VGLLIAFIYSSEPQLFDLAADPEEVTDLARKADAKPILDDLEAELRRICDPDEVNRGAKHDQQQLLEKVAARTSSLRGAILDFRRLRECPPSSARA